MALAEPCDDAAAPTTAVPPRPTSETPRIVSMIGAALDVVQVGVDDEFSSTRL
jgi:hypothetical protein